jgi:hypothetical protein
MITPLFAKALGISYQKFYKGLEGRPLSIANATGSTQLLLALAGLATFSSIKRKQCWPHLPRAYKWAGVKVKLNRPRRLS